MASSRIVIPCSDVLARRSCTGIGVHDALSAIIADRAGCDFLWVSSFGVSAVRGLPDVGLLDAGTMAATVSGIVNGTALPVIVDMDAGYGDALKVRHSAELLARCAARGICIEDNPTSKRCSLYHGYERALASVDEHCDRIAAARTGVAGRPCAVIARTEALVAGLGLDEALLRAEAYRAAGADAVFVQAVTDEGLAQLLAFCRSWAARTPLFIAPTCFTEVTRADFHAAGATHYIFANQGIRAAHRAMAVAFRGLLTDDRGLETEQAISSVAQVAVEVGEGVAAP